MIQAILNYFLNSLWQIPLLVLCTWLALRIARLSPRLQHTLWIVTLLLAVSLPLRGVSPPSAASITLSSIDVNGPLPPLPAARPQLPFFRVVIPSRTCNILAGLYLTFTALCLLRLLLAQLAVRRLLAASTPWHPAPLDLPLPAPATRIRVHTLPASHTAPLVVGIFRPVILLPEGLKLASPQQLAAVFAHECAHIRRRDLLANLALRSLTLPIAYHPASIYLHRQVSRTRELLCDALAASALPSRSVYAGSLLSLAAQLIHPARRSFPGAAGLFQLTSRCMLEERIMHLITPPASPRTLPRVARIAAGAFILSAAALAISLIQLAPAVLAAQQPAAPVQAAAPPDLQPADLQPAVAPIPAPEPAPAPFVQSPAAHPLTAQQRKRLEEQMDAATEQIRSSTAKLSDPAFQKRIAEASRIAMDPALQARIDKLSQEISAQALNSPQFKRSIEELQRQLDSPEFQQRLRELTEQARRNAMNAEAQRKLTDELQRRLDSPEFKQHVRELAEQARNAALSVEAQRQLTDELRRQLDRPELRQELAQLRIDAPRLAAEARAALPAPASLSPQPGADGGQGAPPMRVPNAVMAGQRESGKSPVYPPEAKASHISGEVILHAIIGKDGTIESLQIVSGPVELQRSAWEAVKTWVYKPYLLNGQPTAVETTISVNYSFGS